MDVLVDIVHKTILGMVQSQLSEVGEGRKMLNLLWPNGHVTPSNLTRVLLARPYMVYFHF